MAQPETVMKAIREAVAKKTSETGGRNAVAAVLSRYGHHKLPRVHSARAPEGYTVRVYVWTGTPAGDIALITGPSVVNEVKYLDDLQTAKAAPGAYVQAVEGGRAEDQARGGMERVVGREKARQERAAAPKAPRAPRARPAVAPAAKPWIRMPRKEFSDEREGAEPRVVFGAPRKRGNPDDAWERQHPKAAPEFAELPEGEYGYGEAAELAARDQAAAEARKRDAFLEFSRQADRRYAQAAADAREDIARERFDDAAGVLTKAMYDVRALAVDAAQRMEGERLANAVLGPVRAELDAEMARVEAAEAAVEVPSAEVREAVEHAEEAADTAYDLIMQGEWDKAVGPTLDAQATADYDLAEEFGGDAAPGSWFERSQNVAAFGVALEKLVDAARGSVGEGEVEDVRDHMEVAERRAATIRGDRLFRLFDNAAAFVRRFIAAEEEKVDAARFAVAVKQALSNVDQDHLKPARRALEMAHDWEYAEIADALADLRDPASEYYRTYESDDDQAMREAAPRVFDAVWPQIKDEVAYLEELLSERTGKVPAMLTRGMKGAGAALFTGAGPRAAAPEAPMPAAPAAPTDADHMAAFRAALVQALAEAKAQGLL